ncbi:kinase-like domain-containing protein [Dunaliella salina]|uniref:Kinase-like domain-containing protein n=1 Tax=Dunaliella salina TaxID=3046 RepID=A0ABQ7GMJ2_DUNSA|nr:kinase-like domain-containing protein [Dunaliella salina]|eukprot:KAF5835829.1 kinase-like domain-containing protein [Dunaliella salina]
MSKRDFIHPNRVKKEDVLASGGFGIVYVGQLKSAHGENWKKVALKFLAPQRDRNAREREQFMEELQATLETSRWCKHVVQCKGWTKMGAAGSPCLIMIFYEHGTLQQLILENREGMPRDPDDPEDKLPLQIILRISKDVALGLSELHRGGMANEDLKPSNVFLDGEDHAVLADFGLSKFFGCGHEGSMLYTKNVRGTDPFLPPEKLSDDTSRITYSFPADMWSFGILLGQMVTVDMFYPYGRGITWVNVQNQLVKEKKPPSAPSIPEAPGLEQLIQSCLQLDPARRPTADDAVQALERIEQQVLPSTDTQSRSAFVVAQGQQLPMAQQEGREEAGDAAAAAGQGGAPGREGGEVGREQGAGAGGQAAASTPAAAAAAATPAGPALSTGSELSCTMVQASHAPLAETPAAAAPPPPPPPLPSGGQVGAPAPAAQQDQLQRYQRDLQQLRQERIAKFQYMNIYIKNLTDEVDDDKLREKFSQFGTITSSIVMKDEHSKKSRGFGFVCYSSPDEAKRAVNQMNRHMFMGKPLYVALAMPEEDRKTQLEQHVQARNQMVQRVAAGMTPGLGGPMGPFPPFPGPMGGRGMGLNSPYSFPPLGMPPRMPGGRDGRGSFPVAAFAHPAKPQPAPPPQEGFGSIIMMGSSQGLQERPGTDVDQADSPQPVPPPQGGFGSIITMGSSEHTMGQSMGDNPKDATVDNPEEKKKRKKKSKQKTFQEILNKVTPDNLEVLTNKFPNPGGGKDIDVRRLLLNKCQEEFENGTQAMESIAQREAQGGSMDKEQEEDMEVEKKEEHAAARAAADKELIARRRMLGNIQFIGFLYKNQLISEGILHTCITQLLKEDKNPQPEDVEYLCKLMSTVGGQAPACFA